MPELIPEKRLDKNGRLVTKHVRPVTAASASKGLIPAPSTTPAPKPKKVPVARRRPYLWDEYKTLCGADRSLIDASSPYAPDLNYYVEASDVEAYGVLSVVAPRNVLPLLASGAKTAEQAIDFLQKNNLEDLIEDNSALAEEALDRNFPFSYVRGMVDAFPDTPIDTPNYFDAMKANANKWYRDTGYHPGVPQLIMLGRIKMEDLEVVGPTRIKASGSGSATIDQLMKINNGQSRINAHELAEVISSVTSGSSSSHPALVADTVRFADRRGIDLFRRIKNPLAAYQLDNTLHQYGYEQSKAESMLLWHDKLNETRMPRYVPIDDLITLFEAGVPPEAAAEGLDTRMPVHQMVGIHKEGISPSVSGGWL